MLPPAGLRLQAQPANGAGWTLETTPGPPGAQRPAGAGKSISEGPKGPGALAGRVQSWGWESRQGKDGHYLSEEGRGDPWGRTPLEEGVHWAPKVVSACLGSPRVGLGRDPFREPGIGGGPCARRNSRPSHNSRPQGRSLADPTTSSVKGCLLAHSRCHGRLHGAGSAAAAALRTPPSIAGSVRTYRRGRERLRSGGGGGAETGKKTFPTPVSWRCSPPLRTRLRLCLWLRLGVPNDSAAGRAGGARVRPLAAVLPRATGAAPQGIAGTVFAVTVFLAG